MWFIRWKICFGYLYRLVLNRVETYLDLLLKVICDLGDNLLPHCHRVATLLKRWLLGTHQRAVGHEHLYYYLNFQKKYYY